MQKVELYNNHFQKMEISIEKQIIKRRFGYRISKCYCFNAKKRGITDWQTSGITLYAFGYAVFITWQSRKCSEFCEKIF